MSSAAPTGLSPCLVVFPTTFGWQRTSLREAYNPSRLCPLVWAAPLSLATTRGMLSFPPGTEMFQFPGYPSPVGDDDGRPPPGFPIRTSSVAHACTRLTDAFRSVPRPSSALDAQASPVCPLSFCPGSTEKRRLSHTHRRVSRRRAASCSFPTSASAMRLLSCGRTIAVPQGVTDQQNSGAEVQPG